MKRKLISILNIFILILIVFLLIFFCAPKISNIDNNKIKIITTIFPNYDLAKQIGGEKVEVKLLLNSGVESHSYEPTPKDMIEIQNCDIFVYTGEEFEPWAKNLIKDENEFLVVDTSKNVTLINKEEFEEHYFKNENLEEHEHSHEGHVESSYDSHIWLNPKNVLIMIDNVLESLCNLDPQNSDYYTNNAQNYRKQIESLDLDFEKLIKNSRRKEVAFAGEFSYSYFIDRYDMTFASVYNNCGEGEDPSISKVKSVIDYINSNKLPVVFYEELSEGTVAKMIEEETKAESMVFYTIHNANVEKDSYVSLMRNNYNNLKKALN